MAATNSSNTAVTHRTLISIPAARSMYIAAARTTLLSFRLAALSMSMAAASPITPTFTTAAPHISVQAPSTTPISEAAAWRPSIAAALNMADTSRPAATNISRPAASPSILTTNGTSTSTAQPTTSRRHPATATSTWRAAVRPTPPTCSPAASSGCTVAGLRPAQTSPLAPIRQSTPAASIWGPISAAALTRIFTAPHIMTLSPTAAGRMSLPAV